MKPQALICDIDGVVCDSSARLKKFIDVDALSKGDYSGFRIYSKTTEGDLAIKSGITLLRRYFYSFPKVHLLWVTSRSEYGRKITLEWLRSNVISGIKSEDVIMNQSHTNSNETHRFSPAEYKRNILKQLQENYDIVLAIEDNLEICKMYNSEEIPTIHLMIPFVDCLTPAGDKVQDEEDINKRMLEKMDRLTKEEWQERLKWMPSLAAAVKDFNEHGENDK